MQSSAVVLCNLSKQAHKEGFVFDRLYRHFYNEAFYLNGEKNDFSPLIATLKNESYQPKTTEMQMNQQVMGICQKILETVFEPLLQDNPSYHYSPKEEVTFWREVSRSMASKEWLMNCELPHTDLHPIFI